MPQQAHTTSPYVATGDHDWQPQAWPLTDTSRMESLLLLDADGYGPFKAKLHHVALVYVCAHMCDSSLCKINIPLYLSSTMRLKTQTPQCYTIILVSQICLVLYCGSPTAIKLGFRRVHTRAMLLSSYQILPVVFHLCNNLDIIIPNWTLSV